ncbi:MAG: hypothetical protein AAGI53_16430 [Planctomycetota bacterium]
MGVVLYIAASVVQIAVNGFPEPDAAIGWSPLEVVSLGVGCFEYLSLLAWWSVIAWHLSSLGEALGDFKLERRAATGVWLFPLLNSVGAVLCGVGPVVAVVVLVLTLWLVLKATKSGPVSGGPVGGAAAA